MSGTRIAVAGAGPIGVAHMALAPPQPDLPVLVEEPIASTVVDVRTVAGG